MLRRNAARTDKADIGVNRIYLLANRDTKIGAKMVIILPA